MPVLWLHGFCYSKKNFESKLALMPKLCGKWLVRYVSWLERVTSHIRYDSVIYDGKVRYQNRLNGYNLPFFLASDIFFTNYWVSTYGTAWFTRS